MRIFMKVSVRGGAFLLLALAILLAFPAPQTTANQSSECQALIAALRAETEVVAIGGKNAEKNRTGLLGKLDGASRDLDRGKLCGAIGKLADFNQKISQLNASGSINADPSAGVTGLDLIADANSAIACIQAEVAAAGITCPE